jgi:Flp pilus assembly pilin Flp
MPLIRKYLRDETGTSAAEYTLILAIICFALVSSGYKLRIGIVSSFGTVSNDLAAS